MPPNRLTKITESHGTVEGGQAFDDISVIGDINSAAITQIVVSYATALRSITVHYGDVVGVTHGAVAGTVVVLTLPAGEFITTVEGTNNTAIISKIEFQTNKGRKWGPFGQVTSDSTFVFGDFGPGMGLLAFSGKADNYIRKIKAMFGMYLSEPRNPAGGVKYEKHTTSEEATETSGPLSEFAMILKSQTVTLLVGSGSTILNVSSHILCRLPFFRAALQGNFREASEHKITMPEDEPQDITALVEFLYTGSYSYPYHADAQSDSASPTPDLAEGLYHVGVYATAHKYGCTELVATALGLFMYVLVHLEGIEVVRLWKGAYAKDLLLQHVEDHENVVEFRGGLVQLVKGLYHAHRTEMESVAAEFPVLVSDLLRLVVR